MSAKHTQGPWSYYTEPQPNGCPIVGSRGLMVAMLAHTINQDDQRDTAIANARLIAAAPELLEALQMALRYVRCEGSEAEVEQVNAALDKATGEAA